MRERSGMNRRYTRLAVVVIGLAVIVAALWLILTLATQQHCLYHGDVGAC